MRYTPTSPRQRVDANLAALRLLRDLAAEQRPATSAEQAVLAGWSGWGAVPGIFDPGDDRYAEARDELRGLVSDDELNAAQQTVLNAHYTDPAVAAAMWSALVDLGFDRGRVLEPGAGSGNFIGLAPEGVVMVGVEKDPTTARVARALYADADIRAMAFQDFNPREPFAAAIGNVPFAKVTPTDPRYNRGHHSLHGYFLVKSLALLHPGGLLVALSSRYTLDARNPATRRELAELGDLLGALRLPAGAMRAAAGTDVVMDLLVLRRRGPGEPPHPATPAWDRVTDVVVPGEAGDGETTVEMNRYFAERPERVLGVTVAGRGVYRADELLVRGDLDTVAQQVAEGLAVIVAESPLRYRPPPRPAGRPPAERTHRLGDVELASPQRLVPLRQDSFVVSRTGVIYRHRDGTLRPAEVPKGGRDEVWALVRVRDSVVNLMHLEATDAPDADIDKARGDLRYEYQRYRRRWGPINRVKWARTGRVDPVTGQDKRRRLPPRMGGFREDPDWAVVAAVEVYDEDLDVAT
ncbi:MAG TPA: hypothetical protein VE575_06760, partial [Acidimicrobiales bacterium]|nr:hypothetical protein [Acidimicrobiales bacterium]